MRDKDFNGLAVCIVGSAPLSPFAVDSLPLFFPIQKIIPRQTTAATFITPPKVHQITRFGRIGKTTLFSPSWRSSSTMRRCRGPLTAALATTPWAQLQIRSIFIFSVSKLHATDTHYSMCITFKTSATQCPLLRPSRYLRVKIFRRADKRGPSRQYLFGATNRSRDLPVQW